MVEETRSHALLLDHRGQGAFDVDALVDALLRLSALVTRNASSIEELEINPLAVRPRGHGVTALDAVITLSATDDIQW